MHTVAPAAGLLATAMIVCWAPGWRFAWALLPFIFACACFAHFTNTRAPQPRQRAVQEDL